MTPNQLQDNAAALLDLYARAEEEMLRKVARRLARGIDENGWAERKYGEIRQLQVEIRRSLEHLARQSSELRNALVENAFETGEAAFRDEYRALGGFLRAVPESRFNAVATLTNELSERFDAAHSAILRDVDDNYRRIIGAAVSMQATGTITTRDAVKSALNSFAEKGIIGFVDKAGRHWNMDSYAEMAVRTGLMRAMREGYRQDALAHGEELVIISEHEDTCPLCVDWERAVLALTDAGAQHPEAEGTLAEAEAAGLFHPNCGHSMTVYVPGLTDKTSRKRETQGYSRAEDMVGYENRQQQRYMERQVRAWKRRQAVATTPEDERYAKAYVDKWQRALRAYTGETKLPRKITREGGRVKLSEAARKLKPFKPNANGISTSLLQKSGIRGIMNTRGMAMGLRKPASHILTAEEIESLRADAKSLGIPESLLRFNRGNRTAFVDGLGLINVRGDVLPDLNSTKARDRMSSKAVLAHEYYGHYMNHPSRFKANDWRDEFRASYEAAINAPNLTDEERRDLMRDAFDRAQEAGNPAKLNRIARKIIYGY